jgi:hypothetical protein
VGAASSGNGIEDNNHTSWGTKSESGDGPERNSVGATIQCHFHDSPMNLLISLVKYDKFCLRHRILTSPARQEQYQVPLDTELEMIARNERNVPNRHPSCLPDYLHFGHAPRHAWLPK